MKTGIISILGVILLVLTPSLPASAQGSPTGTITITMTGVETRVEIALDKETWALGDVTENTYYYTDSETSWCTITNEGNVNVDLGIKGANAGSDPFMWYLSKDGTNEGSDTGGYPEYALWYHIAKDTEGFYTPITHDPTPVQKADATKITLEYPETGKPDKPGVSKQFGLKLRTPVSFPETYIGHEMPTHITISAVPA